jgi:ketosteroid isomerase-like protein
LLPSTTEGTEMADTAWIYEIFAAFEAKDGERAAAFFAEDAYFDVPSFDLRASGRAALAKAFGVDSSEWSADEHSELENVVCDGEGFAVQWRSMGTRNSDGGSFEYRGASVGRVRDGLVTNWTDYFDPAALGS